jgi:membrane protein
MNSNKNAGGLKQILQSGARLVKQADVLAHGWLGILVNATRDTLKPGASVTAAAIAYFSLFSLFPIILLGIFIASLKWNPLLDAQFIIKRLEFIAPAFGNLLGENIDHITQTRGPVTIISLVGLLWSSSTIFYMLTQTMGEIWGYKRQRSIWKRRGLAILFVLTIIGPVLVLASFTSSIITNLNTLLPDLFIQLDPRISLLVSILINIAFFMLLYMLFPHASATWREILPGAIGAGLLWELAKRSFLYFVSTYVSTSNLIYGSVASIVAFLTWAYLSGLIFLFGAYLSFAAVHRQPHSDGGGEG